MPVSTSSALSKKPGSMPYLGNFEALPALKTPDTAGMPGCFIVMPGMMSFTDSTPLSIMKALNISASGAADSAHKSARLGSTSSGTIIALSLTLELLRMAISCTPLMVMTSDSFSILPTIHSSPVS